MPVKKVRLVRTKRGRMIILTPQEMFDLLKAARKRPGDAICTLPLTVANHFS